MEHHARKLPPCRQKKKGHTSGFTLIELSIVLVIIGLIAGGILVGQTLIDQAKLRKDMALLREINVMMNTFKLKYNCLPGDCTNSATLFPWHATPGKCNWAAGSIYDGNRLIFQTDRSIHREPCVAMFALNQEFGLDIKPFQGVDPSLANYSQVNFPALSATTGNLITRVPYTDNGANNDVPFGSTHYHYLFKHSGAASAHQFNADGGYKPEMAYQLDSKLDDGMPYTGTVTAARYNSVNNMPPHAMYMDIAAASNACVSNAAGNPYLVSETSPKCALRVAAEF